MKTVIRMLLLMLLMIVSMLTIAAAQIQINYPINRDVYQTNERIPVAVLRSDTQALAEGTLALTLTGADGSKANFSFQVKGAPLQGNAAQVVEHLSINGWLLRPGIYQLEVAIDGTTAQRKLEVFSHVRKSTFKIIDWGCPTNGPAVTSLGEDGMGFNLLLASYGGHDQNANIRGGMDYMRNCTMGGAHQMDMRLECDWSDPYVLAGGRARSVRQALKDRTSPNVIGIHFYDEPGLTWLTHPVTKEFTGHGIPAQERSFKSAFGIDPPQYYAVKKDDPAAVSAWDNWARWKLAFMDGAWKYAAQGVSYVRPDFLSATQSVYGWHAFGDGYYFNITRNLSVISGHGGYDDYAGGFMNTAFYQEMGRMRDMDKPTWYLPTWWDMSPSLFRLEQNLSFITNLQGICKPPNRADDPAKLASAEGLLETNKTYAKLGTIFTTMPVTRPPVAVLYSMSQNVQAQVEKMMNFQDFPGQVERLEVLYFASKMCRIPLLPVVEEDVVDGTLAANHKAIVLTGIQRLDPKVVAALETFAAGGGSVIMGDECTVNIKGAKKLGTSVTTNVYDTASKAFTSQPGEAGRLAGLLTRRPGAYFKEAGPVAKALTARCAEIGITPIFECDNSMIVGGRQSEGDIEYIFAVNATVDESRLEKIEDMNAIKAATASISLTDDGRPVYDAVRGGLCADFVRKGAALNAALRFGAGEMRAFARTARPIGGVQVLTPVITRDMVREKVPIQLNLTATLVDAQKNVLTGSAPMRIRVIDPFKVVRYDLYRATARGICLLTLPLAANDPGGDWTVVVTDMLANTEGSAHFTYTPATQCGALAGATRRAMMFGDDWQNIYRFFRNHHTVTIVKGTNNYNEAAANRLVEILRPWGVTCTIVTAKEVSNPEPISDDAKKTWCGPGGFNVPGATLLLGTPADNPLINSFARTDIPYSGTLPFQPGVNFPGPGRGYLAWQMDVVRQGEESITLIAYDDAGMQEAVGTLYEAAAGLDPLTAYTPPNTNTVTPVTKAMPQIPETTVAWKAILPDRAGWMTTSEKGLLVYTLDGSLSTIDAKGKIVTQKVASKEEAASGKPITANLAAITVDKLAPNRVVKMTTTANNITAVAYWGGTLQTFDAAGTVKSQQLLPQDIAGLVWLDKLLVAGLSDGCILALNVP